MDNLKSYEFTFLYLINKCILLFKYIDKDNQKDILYNIKVFINCSIEYSCIYLGFQYTLWRFKASHKRRHPVKWLALRSVSAVIVASQWSPLISGQISTLQNKQYPKRYLDTTAICLHNSIEWILKFQTIAALQKVHFKGLVALTWVYLLTDIPASKHL